MKRIVANANSADMIEDIYSKLLDIEYTIGEYEDASDMYSDEFDVLAKMYSHIDKAVKVYNRYKGWK